MRAVVTAFNVHIFVVLIWTITRPVMPGAVDTGAIGISTPTSCFSVRIVILTIDRAKFRSPPVNADALI